MKRLVGTDFVARTASREDTEALLAELSKSLSRPRRPPAASQNLVCDQILRACVQRLGELGGEPRGKPGSEPGGRLDHAASLLGLAEVAFRGYVASEPALSSPFYLEKILYHLLRNAAAGGCGTACLRAAQLLLVRLRTLRPVGRPCKDFTSIAQYAFLVLWKQADSLGDRLQALHFLLLLENEEATVLPLEPPFFTSRTARQASAAILSEAPREPISASRSRCFAACLLTLRQDAPRPPGLPQAFCCFELALEQCRQLCRAGCYSEAEAAAEDARRFLHGSRVPLGEPLNLLEAAVRLSRVLAEGLGPAEPHLLQAAAALGGAAEASERLLRLLAEGCQLVAAPLGEHSKRSLRQPLSREDVLGLCAFVEGHCRVLGLLLQRVPPDSTKQRLALKQLLFQSLQLFTNMACDTFQCSQAAGWSELERLTSGCRGIVARMLEALEGLPDTKQAKHLDATALCTFKLAYIFYNQNLHEEASSISELFCQMLETTDCYKYPEIPHERLHRCFRLQVESYRKLGRLESALASTVQWLVALRGRLRELLAEPVFLWVRVKTDAVKHGAEELRLRTLKEALEGRCLDAETLVAVLFEELKAYKTIPANTGQERYNVLCDLLEICSEESGRLHERAVGLTELAQLLCYHKSTWQTDCSALDSVHKALRLLEAVPRSAQNQEQLLDDRAQALLWLYICTLESKLEEGMAREQRAKAQVQKNLDDFKPNDLDYEAGPQETFLYEGISFNLATESARSESLDEALALWKQLLASEGVPAVRSPEQTVASLHIMAALYRLMAKPLQATESYLLVRALCCALGDRLGMAGALCQVTKLLLQLECHSYAELFLAETESCLQDADSSSDSYLLLQQTCLVLRSQMCCASNRVEEGLALLLEVFQNPALQKAAKVWYMLRAQVLQLTALFLSLPPSRLSPELRQRISTQGPKTPEAALDEAYKLFRSILLLLVGSDVLGAQKPAAEAQFVDCGDNVLQKWQMLAELLSCMECLVALLGRVEVVCRAKAFCLEGIRLATRLQASRWCVSFLVLKAQLELQQNDLELSHVDLQRALFLLESGTEFDTTKEQRGPKKILPRKGRLEGRRQQESSSEPPGEDEGFLKGPALEFVAMVSRQEKAAVHCSSPQLETKPRRRLDFLAHPAACPCCLCSDLALSALCLRWLLACAQGELAAGSTAEGLGLLLATLRRCGPVAARFSTLLQDKLGSGRDAPELGLLDDLVATGYATLALHSLASPQPERELLEQLEAGLSFVASCRPHLPSLEVSRASLLLAKATVTICRLATKHSGSVASVFPAAWAQQPLPPSPTKKKAQPRRGSSKVAPAASSLPKPKATKTLRAKFPAGVDATQAPMLSDSKAEPAVAPRTLRPRACPPTRTRAQGGAAAAVPRPRAKNQRAKPLATAGATNTCALGNSDAEVSPVVLQPAAVPSSLHQVCTPTKARGRGAPFTVFKDASPPLSKTQLLKAPKVQRSRSRLPVLFSDDSDAEDPEPGTTPVSGRSQAPSHRSLQSASHCRRVLLPTLLGTEGCQLSSSEGSSSSAQPRRGHRAAGTEEKRQQATRRAPARRAKEERGLLRTIKEDKENKELDNSFELSQSCEEEEGAAGSIQLPRRRQEVADGKHEVLQRKATERVPAGGRPGSGNPLCLDALSTALQAVEDVSLLDTACGFLKAAFNCISHCPPGTLYSQLCQLLALATGDQDPVSTAYLLSESVSITMRHQLLSVIHKKLHKLKKKSAAAAAEQLQGLSLQDAPSRVHHLTELQNLFSFSPTGLGPQELNSFREQLQQIPAGVTICLLTLMSIQPSSVGDTLLLTRLERGSAPITIHIPTALTKAPLSSVLSDFDTIQKEQKETISCTNKREWWLCRSELDRRMKSLIDTLETEVLGCWKGVLLPASQEPALAKEAARLFAQLRPCGWRGSDPALLKVLLNAAPLLTPADVRTLVAGLCPSQPCNKAQLLLQEALEKQRSRVQAPGSCLVLVLDKHLQKLPWESMACLRAVPVTRLPSLRFLLSYNLAPRQAGSVLRCGVNPTRTFYVLNPQNNLPSTEECFRSWFESQQGWSGVTGANPSQEQMQAALLEHNLYIYLGHGAGARLLDGTDMTQLDCNAVALLFGCSSAALAVRGRLEGSGIVLKYILAGCPLFLGNLWDVTDRDLDRYTQALLQGWLQAGSGAPLLHYVAQARQAPRLKYLIGAAPVAYGMPVCLQ